MMKPTKLVAIFFVLTVLVSCNQSSNNIKESVNSIIGDKSFIETFKQNPTHETDENTRLQVHLQYVERLLRGRDISNLSQTQQKNRSQLLDFLNEYWTAGVFPKNYDYPNQRIPCFIDKDGHICAVGYLIEKTVGRQFAEKINAKYKYDFLLAMKDEGIDGWIEASGLTKAECAMIQPSYGYTKTIDNKYVSPTYGVSSTLLTGLNFSLSTINAIQLSTGEYKQTIPIISLVTGAGQVALGVLNYPKERVDFGVTYINSTQRNVSLINIGIGTSAMVLGGLNLLTNQKKKDKSVAWNLYSFPTMSNTMGVGFNLTKRL
jgi:hypothetical protein